MIKGSAWVLPSLIDDQINDIIKIIYIYILSWISSTNYKFSLFMNMDYSHNNISKIEFKVKLFLYQDSKYQIDNFRFELISNWNFFDLTQIRFNYIDFNFNY